MRFLPRPPVSPGRGHGGAVWQEQPESRIGNFSPKLGSRSCRDPCRKRNSGGVCTTCIISRGSKRDRCWCDFCARVFLFFLCVCYVLVVAFFIFLSFLGGYFD